MPEVQYSSLDGTVSSASDVDSKPTAAAIARRSISIFSRRGTGPPEHETDCIDQATMSRVPTKNVSERRHNWLRRKSLDAGALQEPSKGTILKAVPPTDRLRMTRLEEEMATSPNEEIISAISTHPSSTPVWHKDCDNDTFSPAVLPNLPQTSSSGYNDLTHQTESVKRRETNDRIGVWVNGITHWDDNPSHFTPSQDLRFKRHSITESRRLEQQMRNRIRPTLTVAIPGVPPIPANASAVNTSENSCQPSPVPAVLEHEGRQPTVQVHDPVSGDVNAVVARTAHTHQEVFGGALQVAHRCSSSSTGSSVANLSDASINSKRSSATSAEAAEDDASGARGTQYSESRQRHASEANCAVGDDASLDINKPLPRVPVPKTMRTEPALPPSTIGRPLRRDVRIASAPGSRRINRYANNLSAPRTASSSQSLHSLDFIDAEFMRVSPYAPSPSDSAYSEADSPTLSQAEHDLQAQLGSISELMNDENATPDSLVAEFVRGNNRGCDVVGGDDRREGNTTDSAIIKRADSVRSVMQPPARAPTLPKRSRKREWRKTASIVPSPPQSLRLPPKAPGRRKSESALASSPSTQQHETESLNKVHRSESTKAFNGPRARPRRSIAAQDSVLDVTAAAEPELQVSPHSDEVGSQYQSTSWLPAKKVLIRILSSLTSTRDLFSMAMINKGMYRVFKENELDLIGTVSRNQSPAGWELREWRSSEGEDDSLATRRSHTTQSYLSSQRHDETVVRELMELVLKHCQTFIRRETALAFTHSYHPKAQRFIDAFWRIWTFCTIFGSQKGREEDITGQLDWLKGGLVANNQSFSATVNTNLDFDMGSVLLNAPDHFAKGNDGGLSAAQLYDMTELWNCLRALLTGYQGHTEQARQHGIFSKCDIEDSVLDEEQMIEEWIAYVLTLGPEAVLQLAKHATDDPAAGFALAETRGWTDWALSETGTRTTFLKEPVSRLYEERIMNAAMRMQNPDELEKKENARKRVAALAAEIRLRRQSSGYKRLPVTDMRNERAMSTVSRHSSAAPSRPTQMIQTSDLPLATRYYALSAHSARSFPPSSRENIVSPLSYTSAAASARPSSPTGQWSSRHISPIIEDRVEAFNRLSLANLDGNADSTAERAVQKITEMGFTEAQAKHALRMTDMGDGLRVDRAVDMLLRT
ncbi:hypothetical protein WHR41_04972 [Cladosporium halotolerans]|uniref:UBA domain-containing protein n=1 Tax=Cladosporium halotolerans TaxID=1052096 RepID=A0AB34KRM5_9PEZI